MQKMIQHIYLIPLLLSMLVSLKSFKLNWPLQYKTFSLLLIFIFTVEAFALAWKYYLHDLGTWHYSNSNLWLYNIFLVPQYLLYMAVYYEAIKSKKIKIGIITGGILFTVFAVCNNIFFQSIYTIDSFTIILACSIIIGLTIVYFEQLRREKKIIRLTSHPMVWITLGAFIFHTASLPYMISLNYLTEYSISLAVALFYIYLGLNCIMYSLYSIAYLCKHPLLRY